MRSIAEKEPVNELRNVDDLLFNVHRLLLLIMFSRSLPFLLVCRHPHTVL